MRAWTTILLYAVLAPAAAASAQALTPLAFVDGALLASRDSASGWINPAAQAAGLTSPPIRTDPGGGVTAGLFLTPRYSLRLEVEVPTWGSAMNVDQRQIGYSGDVTRYSYVMKKRPVSYAMLFGPHFHPQPRVDVAILAGVTPTYTQSKSVGFVETLPASGGPASRTPIDGAGLGSAVAVSAGFDAAIALSPRLALVPQLRVHAFESNGDRPWQTIVRPRVALRWTFGEEESPVPAGKLSATAKGAIIGAAIGGGLGIATGVALCDGSSCYGSGYVKAAVITGAMASGIGAAIGKLIDHARRRANP